MAATLDHEAEIVRRGEADGGSDVVRVGGVDRIDAWRRAPRAKPARALRQADLIPDEERVRKQVRRRRRRWAISGDEPSADLTVKLGPFASTRPAQSSRLHPPQRDGAKGD